MSIIGSNILAGASGGAGAAGYEIERSIRLNSSDSAYLSRTPSSAGNRKTWTLSFWIKRAKLSTDQSIFATAPGGGSLNGNTNIKLETDNALRVIPFDSGGSGSELKTNAVFRDPSAWYHVVISYDTTQSTSSDRAKIYINGVLQSLSVANYPSQNADLGINNTIPHVFGRYEYSAANYLDSYLANCQLIDGQALDPTSFGKYDSNNVWQPKEYSGTYGTNGFHLDFSDNTSTTTIAEDSSGNNNDWTANNLSVASGAGNDSLVDTPTSYGEDTGAGGEVRGNYATLNPLDKGSSITLSNGSLDYAGGASNHTVRSTIQPKSGKWYWEASGDSNTILGISASSDLVTTYPGESASSRGYFAGGSSIISGSVVATWATYTSSDTVGFALDVDAGTCAVYKNNSLQGTWTGLTNPVPAIGRNSGIASVNFGQRPFAYTAPSGFKALCTTNLDDPTIADGSTAMDVVLDTGANILTAAQGAIGGSADLLWIKDRANSNNHQLIDTVRGGTATLQSNTTAAETTYSAPSGSSVAWTWDGGTSTVSNTDGSITSSVRANQSAGFSIVKWTATNGSATIGHGLNAAPQMIFVKDIDTSTFWQVYHSGLGNTKAVNLNSTNASSTATNHWNNTSPTSSVFSVGVNSNYLTDDHIAYCFAPVAGYSAFGSYTGNGSTDGPFIYTGFRPAFVIQKRTDSTGNWRIRDTKRSTYNAIEDVLYADTSSSTITEDPYDFLSNGFKIRTSGPHNNASGGSYIYLAFAENPLKYARAR